MMKTVKFLSTIVAALIPWIVAYSQIKVSEKDRFTNQYRILTNDAKLLWKLNDWMKISYRSIDTTIFFQVYGGGNSCGVLSNDDILLLLLEDNTTVKIKSKGIQGYHFNKFNGYYCHEYYINYKDVKRLSTTTIRAVRTYISSLHYVDNEVKLKHSKKVNQLSFEFLTELDKQVKRQ
ncbi:MAG: hypothetical protein IPL35_04385 [Sphingobacteriales bacterium]|nr:hypothetical protein [Sphingobacteriales bacterium]